MEPDTNNPQVPELVQVQTPSAEETKATRKASLMAIEAMQDPSQYEAKRREVLQYLPKTTGLDSRTGFVEAVSSARNIIHHGLNQVCRVRKVLTEACFAQNVEYTEGPENPAPAAGFMAYSISSGSNIPDPQAILGTIGEYLKDIEVVPISNSEFYISFKFKRSAGVTHKDTFVMRVVCMAEDYQVDLFHHLYGYEGYGKLYEMALQAMGVELRSGRFWYPYPLDDETSLTLSVPATPPHLAGIIPSRLTRGGFGRVQTPHELMADIGASPIFHASFAGLAEDGTELYPSDDPVLQKFRATVKANHVWLIRSDARPLLSPTGSGAKARTQNAFINSTTQKLINSRILSLKFKKIAQGRLAESRQLLGMPQEAYDSMVSAAKLKLGEHEFYRRACSCNSQTVFERVVAPFASA